jgi:hypothetical protein
MQRLHWTWANAKLSLNQKALDLAMAGFTLSV